MRLEPIAARYALGLLWALALALPPVLAHPVCAQSPDEAAQSQATCAGDDGDSPDDGEAPTSVPADAAEPFPVPILPDPQPGSGSAAPEGPTRTPTDAEAQMETRPEGALEPCLVGVWRYRSGLEGPGEGEAEGELLLELHPDGSARLFTLERFVLGGLSLSGEAKGTAAPTPDGRLRLELDPSDLHARSGPRGRAPTVTRLLSGFSGSYRCAGDVLTLASLTVYAAYRLEWERHSP